ncbi:MAG TPA: CocE/NonD family hydrolase [Planctomycetaceae bacterium]|jgi:putative CocE/NonD family hydrolase|nr:CocE/NonD family hydrolase [Planctomycetaceae bacterium]
MQSVREQASIRRPILVRLAAAAVLVLAILSTPAFAQRRREVDEKHLAEIKAQYTKYEYRIPMRDGKRLFSAVYVPKDDSRKYPIMLNRTPYSVAPYGADEYRDRLGPSKLFDKSGYIFVLQDVRGRMMSEGDYVNMRPYIADKKKPTDIDESSDTYDTIDWVIKHVPNHNGKVGQWGISYPGFYTVTGMIDAHPALVAASPQAPVTDWFIGDDWHHNGALQIAHMLNFLPFFDRPRPVPIKKFDTTFEYETPDGYDLFLHFGPLSKAADKFFKGETAYLKEVCQHGNYDDWWKARNIRAHIQNIKPAVMTVGGWYDAENLFGALEVYRKLLKNSPATDNRIVVGPWVHGGWSRGDGSKLGDVQFNAPTAEFYQEKIEFPFFEHHLKGKDANKYEHPKAWVFETGTNLWRKYESWPPKQAQPRSYYFASGSKLSSVSPSQSSDEADEYLSDPSRPVPYQETTTTRMTQEYMTADQRFASRRPDVLFYETGVLDGDVTVAGPIAVDLNVSTTGTDSDWVVKLIDVYPNDYPDPKTNPTGVRMGGYQQLVRGDVFRGKFRNSFEKPEAFEPGKPAEIKFSMQDVCHTFRSGHRIMVQVQSSWFPLIDRNPQKFVDIYSAGDSDYQKATQHVYHSHDRPSHVTVLVMP